MGESSHFFELAPFTVSAPVGLRFWDTVTRRLVGDGLTVTTPPSDRRGARSVHAFVNRSGTWVLRGLPGLRDFEIAAAEKPFRPDWSPKRSYLVQLEDAERRFLPARFTVMAPRHGFAPFPDSLASPSDSRLADVPDGTVPLYPSPARFVPSGMACVRMQLRKAHDESPPGSSPFAAWAVVDAVIEDRVVATSYADDHGRVAIIFPYPAESWPASPPAPGLLAQRWEVRLRAGYDRLSAEEPPPLGDVLRQRPATLWDDSSCGQPLQTRALEYGAELVVRSRDAAGAAGAEIPELLITQGP